MAMRKSIIVAIDQNNGIGYQSQMPWHLPAELKRFKQLTMGHHLIMGRKTYESIGKPLPGRTTIIVAHRLSAVRQAERALVFENGKIVEEGGHKELIEKDGLYASLYA